MQPAVLVALVTSPLPLRPVSRGLLRFDMPLRRDDHFR
jgi:hypothetical protein